MTLYLTVLALSLGVLIALPILDRVAKRHPETKFARFWAKTMGPIKGSREAAGADSDSRKYISRSSYGAPVRHRHPK